MFNGRALGIGLCRSDTIGKDDEKTMLVLADGVPMTTFKSSRFTENRRRNEERPVEREVTEQRLTPVGDA